VNLIIDCQFTAPPSEIGAFRTLTLYATIFKKMDCLIESPPEEIDYYYKWLKNNYALDFVKQIVYYNEETGLKIKANPIYDRITFNNLNSFIKILN